MRTTACDRTEIDPIKSARSTEIQLILKTMWSQRATDRIDPKNRPKLAGAIAANQCGFGSPTRARTWDLRINSPSLYQLSYRGTALNYSRPWILRSNRSSFSGAPLGD